MLRTATLLLFALSVSAPALARPLVDLAVIDRDTGRALLPIPHRGEHWIAGDPGHRYAVRLSNGSGERVLVVLSVDGINAVTGATADPSQTGYVLGPWQSTGIAGWRKSHDDIAQFVFTALPDSYAARTRRPDHVGVIGIAVFQEARAVQWPRSAYAAPAERSRSDGPPASPSSMPGRARNEASSERAAASAGTGAATDSATHAHQQPAQRIGTGHGAREWSPVSQTGFVRATRQPAQISQLRYDARATLVARGILPPEQRWQRDRPQAFPNGFVADPPRR